MCASMRPLTGAQFGLVVVVVVISDCHPGIWD